MIQDILDAARIAAEAYERLAKLYEAAKANGDPTSSELDAQYERIKSAQARIDAIASKL